MSFNKVQYDNQYIKTHYKAIKVLFKIDSNILDRLETLQEITKQSKNEIIINAVKEYLDKWNI